MTERSSLVLHLLLLTGLCGVLYFPYLGNTPFFDKGEPREALAVQDIVQRGEWLFPLKRATAIPSKPPLFHWSAALTAQITGKLDEATIRFPSALYATLGVLFVYLFGRQLFGSEVGLLGGAVLATTLIYGNQALSARVDMTLSFFVTASLVVFYALYRGFLIHPVWYFLFYALVGIGTLAKGPLGILLPGLVIAVFLALKRRWDLFLKFALHPGAILTFLLAVGWYALAIIRGGEGFVDKQLLSENLERFFGGSGHSHPIYYYIPYLFSLGLPWSLLLPFVLWDFFKNRFLVDDDPLLFLELWFLVMFVFFSVSVGKRPVYILPLYAGISLLMAVWIWRHDGASAGRRLLYRVVAGLAGLIGLTLLVIVIGAAWNQEPGWFFAPIARLLKPKDRANLMLVQNALNTFGWSFTAVSLIAAALWLSLGCCLWLVRMRSAALMIVLVTIPFMFISRAIVIPVIAADKSYRDFVEEVNRLVHPTAKLYLYGGFNSDPVIFYRGDVINALDQSAEIVADKTAKSSAFIIMNEQTWKRIQQVKPDLPSPLLKSQGKGPEGDAPLLLVPARVS